MKRYLMIKNIGRLVTMTSQGGGELGVIENACCLIRQGKIECVGNICDIPQLDDYLVQTIDAGGGVVMPGLIDCHTHLVHAGYRQNEMVERSKGTTYTAIAEKGGGIISTVESTRKAAFEELCSTALARANEAFNKGVTTIEVKSGYGLDPETEIKMLKVVEWLSQNHPADFVPTFLGAHAIPKEFKDNRGRYIDIIINEMLPKIKEEGLALFCDVFVDDIGFTPDEARKIIEASKRYGLKPKLHADQFKRSYSGAELAAELGCVSADHLDYVSDTGIAAMREKGVIPVILPSATFFTSHTEYAPAKNMIGAGLPVAVSTDYNPGTSPTLDLFLAATVSMCSNGLTADSALKGITINAAKALNIDDGRGTIKKDGPADIIILDAPDEYFPLYRFGSSHVKYVIKKGMIRYSRGE